ncbi:MAG: GNAT family N-acetyltransferase [Bacilli bacterium]|nr:GNAT family N-acetyltransferase [Bacilli bacterium]
MELKLRLATRDDVKEIIDVCNICFDEHTDYEKALKVFDATSKDPNQLYIIGICDNKIVAHTKITIIPTMFDGMDTYAILNHVCVLPEYRRHHFAKYMIKAIKDICKDRGCCAIKLWSRNFRQPAHQCYLNAGFEILDAKFFELHL